MDNAALLSAFERDSAAIVTLVGDRVDDLDTAADFLDGWKAGEIIGHLGRIYGWVAGVLDSARTGQEAAEPASIPEGGGIASWFGDQRDAIVAALGAIDPDTVVPSFAGQVTAVWWVRRMAHETSVHRWDLETVFGGAGSIDPDLAADGIAEYLDVGLRFSSSRPDRTYPAETLHLHRTDGDGEWMLARGAEPTSVVVTEEHGKGDAAVRGSAESLLLWVWGRPTDDVEVFGAPDVAAAWQAIAP